MPHCFCHYGRGHFKTKAVIQILLFCSTFTKLGFHNIPLNGKILHFCGHLICFQMISFEPSVKPFPYSS